MKLRGRNVVLFGEFSSLPQGRDEAVRRLEALGARVTDRVDERTDLLFLAHGERGPIPRDDTLLQKPYFDEDALKGMLEREEGGTPRVAEPPPFLPPGAVEAAEDADALLELLERADWSGFGAHTGDVIGDFTYLRVPEGPRPVEDDLADLLDRQIFALDDDTWAMTLRPDAVIAPDDSEDELDDVLAWAVAHRYSWPVRWGDLRVLPDALAAARVLDSDDGELLRAFQDDLEEAAAEPADAGDWPPPDTATLDDLYAAALRSVAHLDADRWGFATGRNLRAAARLRARHGEPDGTLALVDAIPDPLDQLAAAADVTVILARAGRPDAARSAYARAESRVARAAGAPLNADRASSFAAACQAMGNARAAEDWFRYARGAIDIDPNPWEDHLAVLHSMLECGRDDLAREILADRDGHPPAGYTSEPEWLVYLVRSGRLDWAHAFQTLPGWEVPTRC